SVGPPARPSDRRERRREAQASCGGHLEIRSTRRSLDAPRAGARARALGDRARHRRIVRRRSDRRRDRQGARPALRRPRGEDPGRRRAPSHRIARAHVDRGRAVRPYALVAELTYKCPLACAYCSNPLDFRNYKDELSAGDWARVFREAEALGVVQAHVSGGEPLVRRDLEAITKSARDAGLYVHLVTSGIPLEKERIRDLAVDAVQVSLQGTDDDVTEKVAGLRCHARKLDAIRAFQDAGLSVTINVVLHRQNIAKTEAIIALAESLGARRLELANVQVLAWALKNSDVLLPEESDVDRVRALAE